MSEMPVLTLNDAVLFPGIILPAIVMSRQGVEAVNTALAKYEKTILVLSTKARGRDKTEVSEADLYHVGTKALITRVSRFEGGMGLTLSGIERVRVGQFLTTAPAISVNYSLSLVKDVLDPESEALHRENLKIFEEMKANSHTPSGLPISELIRNIQDPCHQTYLMAIVLGFPLEKNQTLLEADSLKDLCQVMHEFIAYEQNVQKIREQISSQVSSDIGKEQREYVLRRQLSEIQKELDGMTGKESDRNLEDQILNAGLPTDVYEEVHRQLRRLSSLTESSPEYQVIHSYVKSLIELPWNKSTEDNLDLIRAEKILDEDHYDLKDVKERIIEHLAVMKLNPQAKAPILCFVGPPGVGKTSLGQSIARALGREFDRMSLGGLHDEAELRGHRRTYIGAMPGRLMEAIRHAKVNNPLIMLDEIDKLGADFRGDPAAVLMEILDPSQNFAFHDNYLDVPFDLSHVFFITTANTTANIPGPLLDRMEILELVGYTDYEKIKIARQHLVPRVYHEAGVSESQIHISDPALQKIIREYTREAGVRDLQRNISRILRKRAIQIAKGENEFVEVNENLVSAYLGHEKVFLEKVREKWNVGVATSMAWTEAGGDILYIETSLLPKRKGELKITGHIGDIMRESVTCALSYVWSHPRFHFLNDEIRDAGIHVHVPAGAIPKDGPSAGIAITAALASLYADQPVRRDLAMTGEVTLSGLVLPVGGIKEKVLAAHRSGIQSIMLPAANKKDLEDIPVDIRNDMSFLFVSEVDEVLNQAIPQWGPPKDFLIGGLSDVSIR